MSPAEHLPEAPLVHAVPVRRPIDWGLAVRSPGAAVAAVGFAAGLLAGVLGRRLGAPRRRRRRRRADVLSTRSFLIDVHLLGRE